MYKVCPSRCLSHDPGLYDPLAALTRPPATPLPSEPSVSLQPQPLVLIKPLQIYSRSVMTSSLCLQLLGPSALTAITVFLSLLPLNFFITKKRNHYQVWSLTGTPGEMGGKPAGEWGGGVRAWHCHHSLSLSVTPSQWVAALSLQHPGHKITTGWC